MKLNSLCGLAAANMALKMLSAQTSGRQRSLTSPKSGLQFAREIVDAINERSPGATDQERQKTILRTVENMSILPDLGNCEKNIREETKSFWKTSVPAIELQSHDGTSFDDSFNNRVKRQLKQPWIFVFYNFEKTPGTSPHGIQNITRFG